MITVFNICKRFNWCSHLLKTDKHVQLSNNQLPILYTI